MKYQKGPRHSNYKHGLRRHPLYKVWAEMKQRCFNPNHSKFKYHGGRGIRMYWRWKYDFLAFYTWAIANGWKPGLQIDRYPDNDGPYAPWNCRFATRKGQANNRRPPKRSKNHGLPPGVYPQRKRFCAQIRRGGRLRHLGTFDTPEEAHAAWLAAKAPGK